MAYGPPGCIERVYDVLDRLGPCTTEELYEEVPAHPRRVRAALKHLCQLDRIHVQSWTFESEVTTRRYPRPVWSAGYGRGAKKPDPQTGTQRKKAQRQRQNLNRGATIWSKMSGFAQPKETAND